MFSESETHETQSGGNSKTPLCTSNESIYSEKPKINTFRARKFHFVVNNYTNTENTQIRAFLKEFSTLFVMGLEVGEKGTPHIQGYMEFKNAKLVQFLKTVMSPNLRCFKAKGSKQSNYTYCTKDGNDIFHNFKKADMPIIPYRKILEKLYDWQQTIIDKCRETPDDRTIHWIWDEAGCAGKTSLIKYIGTHPDFEGEMIQLTSAKKDMQDAVVRFFANTKSYPKICFMNIVRDGIEKLSYAGIETIKDMCFASGKYEGGQVIGPCPHIFIFANAPPDTSKWSKDRFNITYIGEDQIFPVFKRVCRDN